MKEQASQIRRGVIQGSSLGAGVILVLVLVGFVNYLSWRHYERFDWTRSKLYTLSEKSLNVLKGLDREVEVVVFMNPGSELYEPVQELLARYSAASSRVTVRELDPAKNLAEAQQLVEKYDIQRQNVVVFVGPDDRRVVEAADLADYDYSGMQLGQAPQMTGFKGEQLFTSAILELVESQKPKLLFTTGHGEAELDDPGPRGLEQVQDFLGRDNFEIEEWASLGATEVPEGTDLLVIAGPTSGFAPPEIDLLNEYLEAGGRMMVLVDPTVTDLSALADTGLKRWLEGYGVQLRNDIVVDPGRLLPFFGAETIFADNFGSHEITESLSQAGVPVVFALARSVGEEGDVDGVEVTELVRTSSEGWGETDLANLARVDLDEEDQPGPVVLGVAVQIGGRDDLDGEVDEIEELDLGPAGEEGKGGEPASQEGDSSFADSVAEGGGESAGDERPEREGGRLVVFGDSDFLTNSQLAQAGNATLVANSFNWLVERESHLGIAPKTPEQVRLSLTGAEMSAVRWLVLGLLPGLGVVAGAAIYYRRRR